MAAAEAQGRGTTAVTMLSIAAFAICVIFERVRITRTLTGGNARNFGITLLLLCFPVAVVIDHHAS